MSGKHNHQHLEGTNLTKIFSIGIIFNLLFVFFEAAAGLIVHSTALLSDAGHNLSDVLSLIIGATSVLLLKIPPSGKLTYGYKKTTILAALVNSVLLIAAVGVIMWESVRKIFYPTGTDADVIIWVALLGILINSATALVFFRSSKKDLNIRAVFWHMATDALVSLGVVVTGLIIKWFHWYQADGVVGLLIGVIILLTTWKMLKESFFLTIDAVPQGLNHEEIIAQVKALPFVHSVHHVHIWAMSTTEYALTMHVVVVEDYSLSQLQDYGRQIKDLLMSNGISHATLEFELAQSQCDEVNC